MALNATHDSRIREVCEFIERSFQGVVCEYSGFEQPRLPTEEGETVLEVFFAPAASARSIVRAAYPRIRQLWREHGVSLVIVTHTVQDTLRFYMSDVLAIQMRRNRITVLDRCVFTRVTLFATSHWAGMTSWGLRRTLGAQISCPSKPFSFNPSRRPAAFECCPSSTRTCVKQEPCHA
jgi:hypothetical protein